MNKIKKLFLGFFCAAAVAFCFLANSVHAASTSWNFKDTQFKNLGTIYSTKTVDNLTLTA